MDFKSLTTADILARGRSYCTLIGSGAQTSCEAAGYRVSIEGSLVGCPCSTPPMHEVVVGALVREGRVLLVHRNPNRLDYPDVWDLPGGHIEPGESELDALTRELHEELGVQIEPESVAHLCRLSEGRGERSLLLSAWLVGDWQGEPTNVAPDEHDEIRWFRPEELPPLAHRVLHSVLVETIRAGF
jgi:8-oxo-dGTP diphosphatase